MISNDVDLAGKIVKELYDNFHQYGDNNQLD
jgi:hypothetical protein